MKFDLIQTRILKGVAIIALTLVSVYMGLGLLLGGALINGLHNATQTSTSQQGDPAPTLSPAPPGGYACPNGYDPAVPECATTN